MKFFRFGPAGHERPGILDPTGVRRDLSSVMTDLRGDVLHPERLASVRELDFKTLPVVADDDRLGPCVGGTRNFVAVGLNYAEHIAESGAEIPAEPVLFNKAPSCIIGPNDDIKLPQGSITTDWEVELAVIIGAYAYRCSESDAAGVIAGYCICNDVSERDYQFEHGGQWVKGKSCPTFGPLGPWLVTPEEVTDVQALRMWLEVNGCRMQTGSTATMIFGVHFLVSFVSRFMALEPGDVITTGTPSGVGFGMRPTRYLRSGDEVRLGISGLGEQAQRVVAGVL